jgi:hypothetical protein
MTTINLPLQFDRQQLELFAKADAMCGLSLPYMREAQNAKRRKSGLIRKILASATAFLF